jgi:hypothetical protein
VGFAAAAKVEAHRRSGCILLSWNVT